MQRMIVMLIVIATVTLLLTTVPVVKALEWWEHGDAPYLNWTEHQKQEWLTEYNKGLQELECLIAHEKETPAEQKAACLPPEIPIKQQLQQAREKTMTAEANSTRITVDDGYTYPANATSEEKAAIDAIEIQAWEEAGRPGESNPNPYCDKVSDEYIRNGGTCHDRYDISDATGLATCNDGSHREDPEDCPDAIAD